MKIKVKNTFKTAKDITFLDSSKHTLKSEESVIVGDYSDKSRPYIFNLLKKGFEVSKVNDDFKIILTDKGQSKKKKNNTK